ncbi:MAG: radical SAM protein [Bacteroidota bacterium]
MTDRKKLYRFPWSKTDNPGGWIEVTDVCDMQCPGCYRSQIEGHRPLDAVYKDIVDTAALTNCDYITIAGGEPLGYPNLVEVVRFISKMNIKPIIISNGLLLTPEYASELKKAGLAKIHLHIDSLQKREGWAGKTETELNELRQYYADMLWNTKSIQCGFHVTVFRSNFAFIPPVVEWCLKNLHKVQHISFIAYRAIADDSRFKFIAEGKVIAPGDYSQGRPDPYEISITSEEMYDSLLKSFPGLHASAYLNGTSRYEINKFINIAAIGSKRLWMGVLGAETVELSQVAYHFFRRRYFAFLDSSKVGRKVFLASVFDREVRKSAKHFIKAVLRNPLHLFNSIHVQSIHFQQPNEVDEGMINFCDDCPNMMAYQGKLINSCRLDEYRKYGGPLQVIKSVS